MLFWTVPKVFFLRPGLAWLTPSIMAPLERRQTPEGFGQGRLWAKGAIDGPKVSKVPEMVMTNIAIEYPWFMVLITNSMVDLWC